MPPDVIEKVPFGHPIQVEDEFAPMIVEKVPAEHAVQDVEEFVVEYLPAMHCVHVLAPEPEKGGG